MGMASSPVHHLRVRVLLLLALYLASAAAGASASAWPSWPWRKIPSGQHDYRDALAKCILFFEGQRSGRLPASQRAAWRGDSGESDGTAAGVDLEGGYYDAGDNVKFGLPMAFSTTMLAWSVTDFGKFMGSELPHARAAVRWGADYLLKAATATPGALYVQVGDPGRDHACWERPEDMDTPRGVYRVDANKPGSDVAGETAAALAASAVVFRRSDPAYSARLLHAAMAVFDFADRHRGSYSDSLSADVCPYYCSYSGYHDELLWAASWLHRASNNATYMTYVQAYGMQLGAGDDDYSFSWDDKRAGTKVLLSRGFLRRKLQGFELYKAHSDSYICSLVPGTSGFQAGQYTPGGLIYKEGESNMQYVTTATFLMLAYAKYLKSSGATVSCGGRELAPADLVALAKRQVDYILGKNPAGRSYMVGFGARYPERAHHRGASMPSVRAHPGRIGCDAGFQYLHAAGANPNVLVGAVLGGPDAHDGFDDDRGNYAQSEPATYINAPLVGPLAFFAGTIKKYN